MSGRLLQSLSKNLLKLGYGTVRSTIKVDKLRQEIEKTICKTDPNKIKRLIKQLQVLANLLKKIINLLKKLKKFIQFVKKLLIGLNILVKLLRFLPIPARYKTVGGTNRSADLLAKIQFRLKAALLMVTGLGLIIKYMGKFMSTILTKINTIIGNLKLLLNKLKQCNKTLATELEGAIGDIENSSTELTSELKEYLTDNELYRGFTFQILEEETNNSLKRRYAVAINSGGILTLTGNLSYATDTQVLIEELKLKIDNENLNGFIEGNQPELEEDIELTKADEIVEISQEFENDLNDIIVNDANETPLKTKYQKTQKSIKKRLFKYL